MNHEDALSLYIITQPEEQSPSSAAGARAGQHDCAATRIKARFRRREARCFLQKPPTNDAR